MAQLRANLSQATYSIRQFRGINENENGGRLKDGEASRMLNFRVTDNGTITPRNSLTNKLSLGSGKVNRLWSGFIGGRERVFSIANGQLFEITQTNGVYSSRVVPSGIYPLPEDTNMFAFGEKLYLLTGEDYYSTDGTSIDYVHGYVPTIMVAANAQGTGTLLDRVNLLNMKRRVRYSADGTSTMYHAPETGYVKIDSVIVNGAGLVKDTDYSVVQGNVYGGHAYVHFTEAPSAGTDNIEIVYEIEEVQAFRSDIYQTARGAFDIAAKGTDIVEIYEVKGLNKAGTSWITMTSPTDYSISGTTMTLVDPSKWGVIKCEFRIGSLRNQVVRMKYAELYNGQQDNRVFLYGNGSNKCVYSGIDENGQATAEYFPDLNECRFGNTSAPLKAMIKHRNRLLAFKDNETYTVYSNLLSLADGSLTTGFYISAINKQIGSCAEHQAVTVENRVRTLDGSDIYEWKSTNTSGNITADERNTDRISQRVFNSLSEFDLPNSKLFFDKERHEFYCYYNGKALVQNVEADAWYAYDNFPVECMCVHDGKLLCGTTDGHIAEMDKDGAIDFDCEWESGELDFDRPYVLKHSPTVWVTIKPENEKSFEVSAMADTGENVSQTLTTPPHGFVKHTLCAKLKARKFTHYKMGIKTKDRMTFVGANATVIYTNNVK